MSQLDIRRYKVNFATTQWMQTAYKKLTHFANTNHVAY